MNRTLTLTIIALLGTASLTAAALTNTSHTVTDAPGLITFNAPAPHHRQDLDGVIWYPSQSDGSGTSFGENGVFFGVDASRNATLTDGNYPVVVLSHGMGGHYRTMSWLASELADRGAIVVAMNHPNSSWGDFDIAAGINHWTRAQDMTLALDTLMADPMFAGQIDHSRIMAAGFSYGGWTALSVGGVLGDHAGYLRHCEEYGAASSHCDDLMNGGAGLADKDPTMWNASYADNRFTHILAADPALIWGMEDRNVANIHAPVHLVALGEGDDRLLATDFETSGFGALLPDAQVDHFAPASHFMFLPLCKPAGEAILIEENDDPVCTDPDGADRAQLHSDIIDLVASDLGL